MVAASGGNGQAVSIPELKMGIAKALNILVDKLDSKSQTKEDAIVQDSTFPINSQQHNSNNV